jgi:hypothetical protein
MKNPEWKKKAGVELKKFLEVAQAMRELRAGYGRRQGSLN